MSVYEVKLSHNIIKLWIGRAIRNLKEHNNEICFENILNEIKQFDVVWIKIGLSEKDIQNIKNVYELGNLEV